MRNFNEKIYARSILSATIRKNVYLTPEVDFNVNYPGVRYEVRMVEADYSITSKNFEKLEGALAFLQQRCSFETAKVEEILDLDELEKFYGDYS